MNVREEESMYSHQWKTSPSRNLSSSGQVRPRSWGKSRLPVGAAPPAHWAHRDVHWGPWTRDRTQKPSRPGLPEGRGSRGKGRRDKPCTGREATATLEKRSSQKSWRQEQLCSLGSKAPSALLLRVEPWGRAWGSPCCVHLCMEAEEEIPKAVVGPQECLPASAGTSSQGHLLVIAPPCSFRICKKWRLLWGVKYK